LGIGDPGSKDPLACHWIHLQRADDRARRLSPGRTGGESGSCWTT